MRYKIPILKRAVPSFKKRLAKLTSKGGFLLKRSHGAVFLLNYRNFVDRQIAFYDDYEDRQLGALLTAIRAGACDLFLDIGANIGFYSVIVALNCSSEVIAFEPDQRNSRQLGANLLMNRLIGRVRVVTKAVSSRTGPIRFQPSPDASTGQSSIRAQDDGIEVEAIRMDDLVNHENKTIFIKIDIEGHELEAIKGMSRLLARNKVFIQVECFDHHIAELTSTLAGMGITQKHRINDDYYYSNF